MCKKNLVCLLLFIVCFLGFSVTTWAAGNDSAKNNSSDVGWLNEANDEYEIRYEGEEFLVTDISSLKIGVFDSEGEELDDKYIWVSSNPAVASISNDGLVEGKKVGETVLSCYSPDMENVFAETHMMVVGHVSEIVLSQKEASLSLGGKLLLKKITLVAEVSPEAAYFKTVKWESSDTSVAEVNQNGNVTAVGVGECTITAKTAEQESTVSASCKITVTQSVSSIEITNDDIIWAGSSKQIIPNVMPENASNKNVVWESEDETVAVIDGKGNVKGVAPGKTKIKCTAVDGSGASGECIVQVECKVESAQISEPQITLLIGAGDEHSKAKLSITTEPENAFYQTAAWTSSDEGVVSVDKNGMIQGKALGDAKIIAISDDPDYSKPMECAVHVIKAVETIELSDTDGTAYTGTSVDIIPTVLPEDAGNKSVVWTSSDENVAIVDPKGQVKFIGVGRTAIEAVAADGSEVSAKCEFDVIAKVSNLSLSETSTILLVGVGQDKAKKQLELAITPEDAYYQTATWTSSDESVVSVDNGLIKAVGLGNAVITAASEDPDYDKPVECNVSVCQAVKSIGLNETDIVLYTGESFQLISETSPDIADNKNVIWSVDNSDIASVDAKGNITGLSVGNTKVTCTATDGGGAVAECNVTVRAHVKSLELEQSDKLLLLGGIERLKNAQLTYKINPENAYTKTVTWSSSDENVVKVGADGKIVAVAPGKATISIVSDDSACAGSASCKVTVGYAVSSITFEETDITLKVGTSQNIKPLIAPENAYNKQVSWRSWDENIATVDANGKVKAVGNGYVTITCHAEDGGDLSKDIKVKCIQPVSRIDVYANNLTTLVGKKTANLYDISPSDASDKNVSWISSDESVATVSKSSCTVTGKNVGKARIEGTAQDGSGVKCGFDVYVEPASPIYLSECRGGTSIINYGMVYFDFVSTCRNSRIVAVDYDVRIKGLLFTKQRESYSLDWGSFAPGAKLRDSRYFEKLSKGVSMDVTITGVTFADGSYYDLDDTYTFDLD